MVPKVLSGEQKNVARNCVRTFAVHWEWTRFVEFNNYLWWNWDIYVWSRNQATINAVEVSIISKTKKSMNELCEVQGHVVFFDIQGIVMAKWAPSGQTVNQQYYIEVLTKLCVHVRRKRPELWRNGWILHHDNAPYVKQFLANKNITVLKHPPYSPDLAPCNLYLFPKIKSVLKETHFVSVENWKQEQWRSSTALQNMTCRTAFNIGSIVCSRLST